MVLPLLKLGTLVVKTLSIPIASRLKQQAKLHPRFRQLIIEPIHWIRFFLLLNFANHRMTTTIQRRIYGHATDGEIRPLNEEKAVEAAVDLIGEVFVFMVAGVVVLIEVQRSAKSDAKKEEKRRQEMEALRERDNDLTRELEHLKHKLKEIEQLAKGRGLSGLFHVKPGSREDAKLPKPAS